jgi:DNA-binding transcriptional LysR family regulator
VTSVAFGVLPPAFELWHDRYPGTTIALREFAHRRALDDAVRTGVGDIAVGPRPPHWPGRVVDLGWEEFVVVLPASDPLAKRGRAVALDELAERDWVLFGRDHGLSELILGECSRAGFVPRRTVQDRPGRRRRSPGRRRTRGDDRPQQRRATRPQRRDPRAETAAGARAGRIRSPGLVAACPSVPWGAAGAGVGTPTALSHGRPVAHAAAGSSPLSRAARPHDARSSPIA